MRPYDRSRPFPFLTALACLICVVIFLGISAQGAHTDAALRKWGLFTGQDLYNGAYWSLITTAFVHIEPLHLLFNMLWLWTLGSAFEQRFGPFAWLCFVMGSAFVSSGIELYTGDLGIGMSGVGYALFGFGWMARSRLPEFARIVNDQTVLMFIGWGIYCVIATQLGWMHIANLAHAAGFVFGAGVGIVYASEEGRLWPAAAVVLLAVASLVPIFYNPKSLDWTAIQAERAEKRKDYPEAIRQYKHGLDLGANPVWGWYHLGEAYALANKPAEFQNAVSELKRVDTEAARELESRFTVAPSGSGRP